MFIDFHTHIFPRNKGAAILSDLSGRADIPHYTDGSLESLLQSMKQANIKMSLVSRITTQPERVKSVNSWLHESIREGIQPMAAIHPDMPDLEDYIDTLKDLGFKGIKIHPDYQGLYVDDGKMYPVYDTAQALQLPILFHAGLDRGLPPPVHATPRRLLNVHQQFPNLTMIAAHMGGEDNYDDTETYLLGTDIYLDTAFVLKIMKKDTLRRFFSKHPVERFLFGTDSPFTDQATELNYLLDLPFLTQNAKDKISGQNAANLLKL
ncbi:MAG: amidohydrolase family protein [Desulfobacteraceae bacterium]|nr:amidohydrolase family protein [Desulfobacteraceae bacterium]